MTKEIKVVDEKLGIMRVTTVDERWYIKPSQDITSGLPIYQYIPSVTWIAGSYPKGIAFYKWLADKGWDEAEAIKNAAGDKGSRVHKAIEMLLAGQDLAIDAKITNAEGKEEELTLAEVDCLIGFKNWYQTENPKKIIASEITVFNYEIGYAGTIDLIYEKQDGRICLLDFKTGQYVWPEHELQLSAYKHAYDASGGKIEAMELLQVGYRRNKAKFKVTEVEDKLTLFLAAKQIWANEHSTEEPSQKDYPLVISLKQLTLLIEPQAPKATKKHASK